MGLDVYLSRINNQAKEVKWESKKVDSLSNDSYEELGYWRKDWSFLNSVMSLGNKLPFLRSEFGIPWVQINPTVIIFTKEQFKSLIDAYYDSLYGGYFHFFRRAKLHYSEDYLEAMDSNLRLFIEAYQSTDWKYECISFSFDY